MSTLARRLRGALGIATTWGIVTSAVSTATILGVVVTGLVPEGLVDARQILLVAARGFVQGALAGGLFSLILARRERNRTLDTLSAKRAALWGFLGAAGIPLAVGVAAGVLTLMPVGAIVAGVLTSGLFGAALGAGVVRLARREPALAAEPAMAALRAE